MAQEVKKVEAKVEVPIMPIETKHLAIKFGMTPTALRRVLRAMPEYADGVHTNYRWAENDPRIGAIEAAIKAGAKRKGEAAAKTRVSSDESYVIDLCDKIAGRQAIRQKRFDFLRGDPGKNNRGDTLPVDAYYEDISLVVEYWERQHEHKVEFFDKKMTISGCTRGEQRPIYDKRKREVLERNGIRLVVIKFEHLKHNKQGKLIRDAQSDKQVISRLLGSEVSEEFRL